MEHESLPFILSLSPADAANLRKVAQAPRLGTHIGDFGVRQDRGKFSIVKFTGNGKRTSIGSPADILASFDALCAFVSGLTMGPMDFSGASVRTTVDASSTIIPVVATPPTTISDTSRDSGGAVAAGLSERDSRASATILAAALGTAGAKTPEPGTAIIRPPASPNHLNRFPTEAEPEHRVHGSTSGPTTSPAAVPATVVDAEVVSHTAATREVLRDGGSTSPATLAATSTAAGPAKIATPAESNLPVKALAAAPATASNNTSPTVPATEKKEGADAAALVADQLPQANAIKSTAKVSAACIAAGPARSSNNNTVNEPVNCCATGPATESATTTAISPPTTTATGAVAPAPTTPGATPASDPSIILPSPKLALAPYGQTEFLKASAPRCIPAPSSLERAGVTITRETFYAEDGVLLLRLTVDPGTTDWVDSPLTPPNFTRRIWAGKIIFEQRFSFGEHLCRGLDSTARFAVTYLCAGGDLKRIKALPSVYAEFQEFGGAP